MADERARDDKKDGVINAIESSTEVERNKREEFLILVTIGLSDE